jgi:hypothetical protein
MAWGERYVEELFSLTLPAILAENNLPALAVHFSCELVILTEEKWFSWLRQQSVFDRLWKISRVELRSIDDLISRPDAYGMTLTLRSSEGSRISGRRWSRCR